MKAKDVEEAEKRMSRPELAIEKIKAVSFAASELAQWIKANLKLYRVS